MEIMEETVNGMADTFGSFAVTEENRMCMPLGLPQLHGVFAHPRR